VVGWGGGGRKSYVGRGLPFDVCCMQDARQIFPITMRE
jgi:hypothetical protein